LRVSQGTHLFQAVDKDFLFLKKHQQGIKITISIHLLCSLTNRFGNRECFFFFFKHKIPEQNEIHDIWVHQWFWINSLPPNKTPEIICTCCHCAALKSMHLFSVNCMCYLKWFLSKDGGCSIKMPLGLFFFPVIQLLSILSSSK